MAWLLSGYCLVVAVLAGLMHVAGDLWWPATLILYSPRWLLVLPFAVLVPFAVRLRLRLLLPLLLVALSLLCSFTGYNLPLGRFPTPTAAEGVLRVLTCNIQSGTVDPTRLAALIATLQPDLVALQECPLELPFLLPDGWQMKRDGGLAVLSRYPLQLVRPFSAMHPPHRNPRTTFLGCTVYTPRGELSLCNLHLPSPRYGLQNILDRNTGISLARKWLLIRETKERDTTARLVQEMTRSLRQPILIVGDFNMPVESAIYRCCWSGYQNAFSKAGLGFGWTERVTIQGLPLAARIDHILYGEGFAVRSCQVGPDVGSDHLPVCAELIWSQDS